MRRFSTIMSVLALLAIAAPATAQEIIPPVLVGGDQVETRTANGQTIEITAIGVSATVNFTEISSIAVKGVAVRSSGGTSTGTVTIRWISRGRETTLQLGPITPEIPFGMEGGDIDRRTGDQSVEP